MAHEAAVLVGDAELVSDAEVGGFLALEEAEFASTRRGEGGGVGVFHDRGERAVGEGKSAFASANEAVREEAYGVGVALEADEVFPTAAFGADVGLKVSALAVGEEGCDGAFARVAEGRVAHVVRQASG